VDELLRYVMISGSGFIPLARITREEVRLGGAVIPAGETELPSFNVANRDPAAFDDPDRLDVGRAPRTHLGFGARRARAAVSVISRDLRSGPALPWQ
jgi:cytochrome P450